MHYYPPREPTEPSPTKSEDFVVVSIADRAWYWEGRVDEDDEDEMERLNVRGKRIPLSDVLKQIPNGFSADDLYITACFEEDYLSVEVRCTNDVPKTEAQLLTDKENYDREVEEYKVEYQKYLEDKKILNKRDLDAKRREKERLEHEIANLENA